MLQLTIGSVYTEIATYSNPQVFTLLWFLHRWLRGLLYNVEEILWGMSFNLLIPLALFMFSLTRKGTHLFNIIRLQYFFQVGLYKCFGVIRLWFYRQIHSYKWINKYEQRWKIVDQELHLWFDNFFFQTYVVSVGVRAHQINLCIIHVCAQEVYDTFTKTGWYFCVSDCKIQALLINKICHKSKSTFWE